MNYFIQIFNCYHIDNYNSKIYKAFLCEERLVKCFCKDCRFINTYIDNTCKEISLEDVENIMKSNYVLSYKVKIKEMLKVCSVNELQKILDEITIEDIIK